MSLTDQIRDYINAGFSGLWIQTWEPDEVIRCLATESWDLAIWDLVEGLHIPRKNVQGKCSPLEILTYFKNNQSEVRTLVLLQNFHRLLENPQLIQGLFNALVLGKAEQVHYLVLSPSVEIPMELEKMFTVIEHQLPGKEDIESIAKDLLKKEGEEPTDFIVSQEVTEAARGMTRREVEDSLSLSLATRGTYDSQVVWDTKIKSLKKGRVLNILRGERGFNSLGGLMGLKSFARKLLRQDNPVPTKGLMLLGPPGTGKSAWCKALGIETGLKAFNFNVGSVFHKHVGESEANVRNALSVIDAMGRVIVFIDEAEKAFSGVGSDGDSGVATRIFGSILTWLSDREEKGSDAFVVMTSNDISKLPPEFTRAERFDGIFFLDLPSPRERDLIWEMYASYYKLPEKGVVHPPDEGWTGAEIKSCCRLAASLGISLEEASQMVVPVSLSAESKIKELRQWANGKVLSAETGKIFQLQESKGSSLGTLPRRKVDRQQP